MSGLMNRAGAESIPADTGLSTGRNLYDRELTMRSHYADPAVPPQGQTQWDGIAANAAPANLPSYYNKYPAPPVKYSVPTAKKERMMAREAIRQAAVEEGQNRPDPISEDEVDYLQSMRDQAELADFDRYVNTLIDPKAPGQFRVLMELYPEFVTRRVQQAHTDYEFAMRKQMIDTWGIQTFDDLHFLYLCDQGKIKGPQLTMPYASGNGYNTSVLSPWHYSWKRYPNSVRAPFASSTYGPSGRGDPNGWRMSDAGQPLAGDRSLGGLARSMYPGDLNSNAFNAAGTENTHVNGTTPLYR